MGDTINFDYYYGIEAEQFSFYRVPRLLIKDERFKGLSSDAKRVNLEPSGTTSKPQKSRSSWENFKNTIRSVSVGIEKIRCIRSALSIG